MFDRFRRKEKEKEAKKNAVAIIDTFAIIPNYGSTPVKAGTELLARKAEMFHGVSVTNCSMRSTPLVPLGWILSEHLRYEE